MIHKVNAKAEMLMMTVNLISTCVAELNNELHVGLVLTEKPSGSPIMPIVLTLSDAERAVRLIGAAIEDAKEKQIKRHQAQTN